ncbi:Crp/Fnr family transcriptional regulator [Sphingomonas floccifaciens]|uniref:Crp/Fnr family transcriptional regulator n=2 Tax=Sphingomonas TaxID=13687 RepID=A0ABW4NKK6_9SPHN
MTKAPVASAMPSDAAPAFRETLPAKDVGGAFENMPCDLCASFQPENGEDRRDAGRRYAVRRGQAIGDIAATDSWCASLATGVLRIDASQGAAPRTVGLIFPGQIVAHPFDADPCGTAVVAVTRSNICLHARGDLQHVTEHYPSIRRLLLRSAFQTLAETRRWMLVISRPRARERVAAFLVSVAGRFPTSGHDTFDLVLSRGRIGELLGLSLETVSRQIHALAKAGLIALPRRRHVRLLNRSGLEAVAGITFRHPSGAAA